MAGSHRGSDILGGLTSWARVEHLLSRSIVMRLPSFARLVERLGYSMGLILGARGLFSKSWVFVRVSRDKSSSRLFQGQQLDALYTLGFMGSLPGIRDALHGNVWCEIWCSGDDIHYRVKH
ncbi:hypothetical protein F5X98DRAFT_350168 [Xylaria grammica]|nr:hypothetical protein F5X98DRAFT_350168 [Xylaria grammica]